MNVSGEQEPTRPWSTGRVEWKFAPWLCSR